MKYFTADLFVKILMGEYLLALILYAYERNWAKALYWFGALCIVGAVKWMK